MECSICFDEFVLDPQSKHTGVSIGCGHVFGRSCIVKWLKQNPSCPVCKRAANAATDIVALYAPDIDGTPCQELEARYRESLRSVETEQSVMRSENASRVEAAALSAATRAATRALLAAGSTSHIAACVLLPTHFHTRAAVPALFYRGVLVQLRSADGALETVSPAGSAVHAGALQRVVHDDECFPGGGLAADVRGDVLCCWGSGGRVGLFRGFTEHGRLRKVSECVLSGGGGVPRAAVVAGEVSQGLAAVVLWLRGGGGGGGCGGRRAVLTCPVAAAGVAAQAVVPILGTEGLPAFALSSPLSFQRQTASASTAQTSQECSQPPSQPTRAEGVLPRAPPPEHAEHGGDDDDLAQMLFLPVNGRLGIVFPTRHGVRVKRGRSGEWQWLVKHETPAARAPIVRWCEETKDLVVLHRRALVAGKRVGSIDDGGATCVVSVFRTTALGLPLSSEVATGLPFAEVRCVCVRNTDGDSSRDAPPQPQASRPVCPPAKRRRATAPATTMHVSSDGRITSVDVSDVTTVLSDDEDSGGGVISGGQSAAGGGGGGGSKWGSGAEQPLSGILVFHTTEALPSVVFVRSARCPGVVRQSTELDQPVVSLGASALRVAAVTNRSASWYAAK
eukprot:Rhum_TRINITY_DN12140_c0_g1::Rhum_TRINITY_DN12140_c0_g1_i1::g.49243::m.49243